MNMHAAPLPRRARQHGRDGLLQALVGVGDDQPHAAQAALHQAPQKRRPEGAIFRRPHVDTEDLTIAVGGDADRDDRRLAITRPSTRTLWYVASTQR
jgi:hypothetical protein